ncbi:hypothetical protein N665_1096s0004 [Sinapis alba]|nr:hypothetical protein N665_1096s0004 [Sinapis alba]
MSEEYFRRLTNLLPFIFRSETVRVPLLLSLSSPAGKFFHFGVEFSFLLKAKLYEVSPPVYPKRDRDALHADEYEELKESRLGVFQKFKELDFGWASKLVHYMLCFQLNIKKKYELWSLVGADLVRFSLIDFEHLTGLNCEYIENLENPRCEVTKEMASFWERIGRKYSIATRASLARLVMDLEKFGNYLWGRVAFKVLMGSFRENDFTKSYIVDKFIEVPRCGSTMLYQNWLLIMGILYQTEGRKYFKGAISRQTRVINYVEKDFEEMFPKWDNDTKDVVFENIIQVIFNAPPSWKWTMNCWENVGTNPWTNSKMRVVYVKEMSFVKSLVVREELSDRHLKKARIKALA